MLRPLALDVAAFLLPGVLCAGLFLLGTRFRRWPRAVRGAALVLALAALGLGVASAYRLLPMRFERVGFQLGGLTCLLCWVACFLLGCVWSVPGRSMSSSFIASIGIVALLLAEIESSGRLWWRFAEPKAWTRFPDSSGLLQQTSATTCSATAATMLLALAGIPASEGEMAYLSGTSLLGADAQGMSLALDQKAASHGWRVEAGPTTYDECVHRGGPFLAHVKGRTTGHAVVVYAAVPEGVIIFDPAVGRAHAEKREDFEPDWDGTAIRLVR